MNGEKLGELLDELSRRTPEPAPSGLAEDIKGRIPIKLAPHHWAGMDTIKIIIDLRISKLTAAAAIIITLILMTVLLTNFTGDRQQAGNGVFADSKLVARHFLGHAGSEKDAILEGIFRYYENLLHQGADVAYYGESADLQDKNAILLQWKISDSQYKVIFADLRTQTISADELIRLQSRMLQKKTK